MNPEHDLAILQAMSADLPEYLLSEVLFWQMQAPSNFPKLSLGYLLLIRARLLATGSQLLSGQQTELARINHAVDAALLKWPVAAEKKAAQELRSRLNLWARFLDESDEDIRAGAENYRHEVNQRVIAALLLSQFPRLADTEEARRLPPLDARLRGKLKAGSFLWPAELQSAFPTAEFWFLYGQLR